VTSASRLIACLCAGVAILWATLVLAAPVLAAGSARHPAALWAAAFAYLAGSLVCHQIPARSFHLAGAQLPVCARCASLYWAAGVGALAGCLFRCGWGRRGTALTRWRRWLVAAAVPTALTLVFEWSGLWVSTNLARALAAVPLGLVGGLLVTESISFRGKL
jgi:uncharacterized membrane protein